MQIEIPSIAQSLSLLHAAEKYHLYDMEAVPLNALVMDSARQNDKRPAYVKLFVPDSWVLSLRGESALTDIFLMFRVPREALDSLRREQTARQTRSTPVDSSAPEPDDEVRVPGPTPLPDLEPGVWHEPTLKEGEDSNA